MSFHVTKKFVCTENYPIVDTPKGKLHGYQDNDIFCFHGIDYAHAERFHEAVPTPAWEGVTRAHDYGCGCPEMKCCGMWNDILNYGSNEWFIPLPQVLPIKSRYKLYNEWFYDVHRR